MIRFGGSQQRASVTSYNSRTSRMSRSDWLGRKISTKRGYDSRRASFTSEDSSFSSVLVTRTTGVAEDTLFSNMMRRLNLSSSAGSTPLPTVEGASGGATVYQNAGNIVELPYSAPSQTIKNRCATIGVQTSLEADDLMPFAPVTFDKSVQVTPPRISSANKNSLSVITPTLLRANKHASNKNNGEKGGRSNRTNKTDEISTSSDERHESTPFKRSKRTGGLSTKDRKVLENNLRNSREETISKMPNVDEKKTNEQSKSNKKDKSRQRSDKQAHRKKKKKHPQHNNKQESSIVSPISRNGSTDYLINRTGRLSVGLP